MSRDVIYSLNTDASIRKIFKWLPNSRYDALMTSAFRTILILSFLDFISLLDFSQFNSFSVTSDRNYSITHYSVDCKVILHFSGADRTNSSFVFPLPTVSQTRAVSQSASDPSSDSSSLPVNIAVNLLNIECWSC